MVEVNFAVLVAVVVGLVEAAKRLGVPTRFCPLLALVAGVVLSFVPGVSNFSNQLFTGLVVGLSASGLFDLGKQPVRAVIAKLGKS
jgi:hypothetical protein